MFTLSLTNLQHSLPLAICLCLFMLACHIFVNNHEAKEILDANATRKAEVDLLRSENHKILHSGKGKQGEDAVYRAVLSIFQSLNLQIRHQPRTSLSPCHPFTYRRRQILKRDRFAGRQ